MRLSLIAFGEMVHPSPTSQGVATIKIIKLGATLTDGKTAYLGRGVIVHAKPDDLVSQPTGAAGARIACGIINAE